MALVRLQEPANPDCPVIKEYTSLLVDANSLVSIHKYITTGTSVIISNNVIMAVVCLL